MKQKTRLLFVIYILLIHSLLIVVLFKTDFLQRAFIKVGVYQRPEITSEKKKRVVIHLRQDTFVPRGSILFFGDSITEMLCASAIADKAENFGIGGDTTLGLLHRLQIM